MNLKTIEHILKTLKDMKLVKLLKGADMEKIILTLGSEFIKQMPNIAREAAYGYAKGQTDA